MKHSIAIAFILLLVTALACRGESPLPSLPPPTTVTKTPSRLESIPSGAHKMTPAEDPWPPVAKTGFGQPQPLDLPINSAGAEDSPFIILNSQTFYFFFTPDLNIPAEKQLLDGVTGIWMSKRDGENWAEPKRVTLNDPGQLSLDGCVFVSADTMYFCSARAGNLREIDIYTANFANDVWTNWQNAGKQINLDYEVGEMHVTADGQTMAFASKREGGLGGYDLWLSQWTGDGWSEPVNFGNPVNSEADENRPYLSPDGGTLWFDSISKKGYPGPAIFNSVRQADGSWSEPEEMISQFAGEPNLTADGHTLYFVHHYFTEDLSRIIEADIYVVTVP